MGPSIQRTAARWSERTIRPKLADIVAKGATRCERRSTDANGPACRSPAGRSVCTTRGSGSCTGACTRNAFGEPNVAYLTHAYAPDSVQLEADFMGFAHEFHQRRTASG
jgi:hypothetical protein